MNAENVKRSMGLLCAHLAKLNDEVEQHGFTCSAQVYDMAKTLHGLKSAHCLIEKMA